MDIYQPKLGLSPNVKTRSMGPQRLKAHEQDQQPNGEKRASNCQKAHTRGDPANIGRSLILRKSESAHVLVTDLENSGWRDVGEKNPGRIRGSDPRGSSIHRYKT